MSNRPWETSMSDQNKAYALVIAAFAWTVFLFTVAILLRHLVA